MTDGTRVTILIVDDSAGKPQLVAGLPATGYRVLAATSGGRCLSLAHDRPPPDLLIVSGCARRFDPAMVHAFVDPPDEFDSIARQCREPDQT